MLEDHSYTGHVNYSSTIGDIQCFNCLKSIYQTQPFCIKLTRHNKLFFSHLTEKKVLSPNEIYWTVWSLCSVMKMSDRYEKEDPRRKTRLGIVVTPYPGIWHKQPDHENSNSFPHDSPWNQPFGRETSNIIRAMVRILFQDSVSKVIWQHQSPIDHTSKRLATVQMK